MLALKIIFAIIGILFMSFGYFIYFKKKYSLINGFDEAYKRGEKTENYAKQVGIIEFAVGIAVLAATIILIILT